MDWLIEHTVQCMVGTSFGTESFTDFNSADDMALLVETLSVLVLALEIMNEEVQPLLSMVVVN